MSTVFLQSSPIQPEKPTRLIHLRRLEVQQRLSCQLEPARPKPALAHILVQITHNAAIRVDRNGWSRIIEQHARSEEHTSELQSLMHTSYAVFCLQIKNTPT